MHLRSGKLLAHSAADVASRAPTQGSNTRPNNPLDPISEESSESHSDTSSMAARDRESSETWTQDHGMRRGKFSENPFEGPEEELSFNVHL